MRQSLHFSKIIEGDNWKRETVVKYNNFGKEDYKVYNWVNIKKYFYKLLIFVKTIRSDNESDTTEPTDDLCDSFAPTIILRNSEKILFGLNDYSIVGLIRCTRIAMLL